MAEEAAALVVRLEATAAKFERDINRARRSFSNTAGQMERRAASLDKKLESVGSRFGLNINARAAAAAAAIAVIGKVINDVARNGDKFRLLEGRFTAITGSADRGAEAFKGVLETVQDTGAAIDDVAGATARFTLAAEAIGATDAEVQQLTSTVLKLGTIGAASQQQLTSGAIQLAQALASGRLQGDELRSVLENIPLVAKAIADGLGVSVDELRKMGSEGQLTARKVFDAILAKTGEVEEAFSKMPVSLDRAAGQLAGAWAQFTSQLDESLGISKALVAVLQGAAGLINEVSGAAGAKRTSGAGSVGDLRRRQKELEASGGGGLSFGQRAALSLLPGGGVLGQGVNKIASGAEAKELAAISQEIAKRVAAAEASDPRRGGAPSFSPVVVGNQPIPVGRPGSAANPISLGQNEPAFGSPSRGGGGGSAASVDTEAAARMVEAVRQKVQALNEERAILGATAREADVYRATQERARIEQEVMALAARENTVVTEAQKSAIMALADEYLVLAENVAREREAQDAALEAQQASKKAAEDQKAAFQQLSSSIIGTIANASSFEDALKRLGLQLADFALQAILTGQGPLAALFGGGGKGSILGKVLGGVVGIAGGALGGGARGVASTAFANGGVIQNGVKRFAEGGVVSGPTNFGMAGGKLGLMGEAGPEGILPLAKVGGKLGVRSSGGGGGQVVNMTIVTPNADPAQVAREVSTQMQNRLTGTARNNSVRGL